MKTYKPLVIITHLLWVLYVVKAYALRRVWEPLCHSAVYGSLQYCHRKLLKNSTLFFCLVTVAKGNCGHSLACGPLGTRFLLVRRCWFLGQRLRPHGTTHHAWPGNPRSPTGTLTGSRRRRRCDRYVCVWMRRWVYTCVRKRGSGGIPAWPQYLTKAVRS